MHRLYFAFLQGRATGRFSRNIAVRKSMFLHKKQSYPLYFYVNMLEKELALKVSIPFLAPNAAQKYHCFLP